MREKEKKNYFPTNDGAKYNHGTVDDVALARQKRVEGRFHPFLCVAISIFS